jgi:hypothetical protein
MRLRENIDKLIFRGDRSKMESASLEMVLNEVIINFNMLGALMKDIIVSNFDGAPIITIKRGTSCLRSTHVCQKPS